MNGSPAVPPFSARPNHALRRARSEPRPTAARRQPCFNPAPCGIRTALLLIALAWGCRGTAHAAPPRADARAAGPDQHTGDFVFSFLPKSLQRNPMLDMTVNTEVTTYGRLLRPVSPANPVYYVPVPAGLKELGGAVYGEKAPPLAELEQAMKKSLAAHGYLESEPPAHPPALAVIYHWGSHNKLDPDTARAFPELAAKYELERALLIGGKKYFGKLASIFEWGATPADRNNLDLEYLRYQSREDIYFVVASAYDYAALARNQRQLAWRTTMTVNAQGVNMKDTLVPLIATAAPYFGEETADPKIAARRVSRSGSVQIGEATVVEDPSPATPAVPRK